MTSTESLLAAAATRPYLFAHENLLTEGGLKDVAVTYRPTAEAGTFVAAAHGWLDEFVIEDAEGRIIARRKTARGAVQALVKLADATV